MSPRAKDGLQKLVCEAARLPQELLPWITGDARPIDYFWLERSIRELEQACVRVLGALEPERRRVEAQRDS
jgi:hypothetical protein